MPLGERKLHLLAYDIADPRRLQRVHRCVSRHAVALQYSVFALRATAEELAALLAELDGLIDAEEDDIRAYPLPTHLEMIHLGRQVMPSGVYLTEPEGGLGLLPGLMTGPRSDA